VIYWNISPDIVTIGPFTIRWYGLLFALSFIVGFQIMTVIFKKENRSDEHLNDLIWYMLLGTVVGARLGHCLFYNPVYYLSNPLEILMVWKGGLASHGAAIGILTALFLFTKRNKEYTFIWLLDRIVITVALGGFFIRMGNLLTRRFSVYKPIYLGLLFLLLWIRYRVIPRNFTKLYLIL
jgi:prolipoprotein diacylglyceryl transferase